MAKKRQSPIRIVNIKTAKMPRRSTGYFIGLPIEKEGASLVEIAKEGLTVKAVKELQGQTNLDSETLFYYLDISADVLKNAPNEEKLGLSTTDRIIDLAQLYSLGLEVFLSIDDFNRWLKSPSLDLGGEKPITLLHSTQGIKKIQSILMRIQYGIPV